MCFLWFIPCRLLSNCLLYLLELCQSYLHFTKVWMEHQPFFQAKLASHSSWTKYVIWLHWVHSDLACCLAFFTSTDIMKLNTMSTYFIDEISCLDRPSLWKISSLDLNLFRKHHVSNLFSIPSDVRSTTEHKLITNYTHSKVINCVCVILSAHDFWGHISRSSWCVLAVLWT